MLGHLDTRDIMQCQRVCRNWSTVCQRKAYTDVTIYYRNEMSGFLKIASGPLGKLVKRLHIRNEGFNIIRVKGAIKTCFINFNFFFSPGVDITSLPTVCPNLEVLKFDLLENVYWEWIYVNCSIGHWKHMNTLPYPTDSSKAGEYYSKTIHILRRNMKEIKLFAYGTRTSTSQALIESLDDFQQLETLRVGDLHAFSLELDQLIDKFPQLKRIFIKPEYVTIETYLNREGPAQVKPSPTVEEIDLNGITLSVNALRYIMKKFPNLKRLQDVPFSKQLDYLPFGPAALQEFANYVKGLDYLSMEEMFFEDMTEFISVMADKLSDRQYLFELSARYHGIGQVYFDTSKVVIEKDRKREQVVSLKVDNKGQVFPFGEALSMLYGKLTILKFNHVADSPSHFVARRTNYAGTVHKHYLDDITSTCPKLKRLYINRFYLIDCQLSQPSTSISQLYLQQCYYVPQALFQLSEGLPRLRHLSFAPMLVLDPVTLKPLPEDPDHVAIDMPYTRLSTLFLEDIRFPRRRKSIFMKLMADKGVKYYQIHYNQMTSIPKETYQKAVTKQSHFSLRVRFKHLDEIRMLGQTFKLV
ncbi:hypothetical protein A0J61_09507 [Choanephora cucurbitarum]|uniref:F-box domain-containing protein n=1 Tax=Choanephora cucurbitarum TaxID=101091 RepID=A0A1C7N092_9FUNG|nr:hypothetical protein A0J61_09507 [Choanephora cucurbitarum]